MIARSSMLLASLALVTAACDDPKPATTGPAGSASAASSAAVVTSAAPMEKLPPAPVLVDLLQGTESDVAVSSNADGAKNFPELLLDGKNDTAWTSKVADLKGWISFRVPKDATVARILMTVGADGESFSSYPRVKKVRVTRDGAVAAEKTLDLEKRTLQSLALTTTSPGGTFKIEIVDTEPGSKKDASQLRIGELRVLGNPGKEHVRNTPRMPEVRVGSLPDTHVERDATVVPSLAAGFPRPEDFCKAFRTVFTPINAARKSFPGPVETTCAAMDASSASIKAGVAVAPFVDVLSYAADNDVASFGGVALRTDKSWFYVGPHLSDDPHGDPHAGGYGEYEGDAKATFVTTSKGPTTLITWHYGSENKAPKTDPVTGELVSGTAYLSRVTFYADTCVAAGGAVTCEKPTEVEVHRENESLSVTKGWRSTKTVTVKPDGTLSF